MKERRRWKKEKKDERNKNKREDNSMKRKIRDGKQRGERERKKFYDKWNNANKVKIDLKKKNIEEGNNDKAEKKRWDAIEKTRWIE